MEKRLHEVPTGYTERHHILPRCFGGTNEKINLVRLTAREHLIAHLLLTKCTTGGNRMKMCRAALNMSHHKGVKINSRLYESLRIEYAEYRRMAWQGEKNPFYGSHRSGKLNPFYRHKPSKENIEKIIEICCIYNYIIKNPDGDIIKTDNLRKFCREHKLNRGTLRSCGKTKKYILLNKELKV